MKFGVLATSALLVILGNEQSNAFSILSNRPGFTGVTSLKNNGMLAQISTLTSRRMSSSASAKTSFDTGTGAASSKGTEINTNNNYTLDPDFQEAKVSVTSTLTSVLENKSMEKPLIHFINEYFQACNESRNSGDDSVSPKSTSEIMMKALQYGMQFGLTEKYVFGVTHKALRGADPELEDGNTVDFYNFGCDFFRPAMNLKESLVLGEENIKKAFDQIEAGENVVLFANHQSEADPQVMSCLLEKVGCSDEQCSSLTYVAGHKVTTDTLAIPFSMGRNLICIHSKKHIDSDPDTKPIKMKQNLAAMGGMLNLLKKGGTMIWVAPSGGRDRRDLETGKVPIAPFDQKTVDMFRLMGNKSKTPTHYYTVSMVSYDLCPPPDFVEAGTGEQRNVRFSPIGIYMSEELENIGGVETRHLFTENAFKICEDNYEELLKKMET